MLGSVGRPLGVDRSTRDRTSRPSLLFCLPEPRSGLTGKATGSVILSSVLTCSWLFVSSLLISSCLLSLSLSLLLPLSLSLLLPLTLSLLLPLSLSSSSSSGSKGASPLGPGMAPDISSLRIKEHKWLKNGFVYVFYTKKANKFIKSIINSGPFNMQQVVNYITALVLLSDLGTGTGQLRKIWIFYV